MTSTRKEKRIEKWPLDSLKPHPQQNNIFQLPTAEDIKQLAHSMQTQPSTTLVEVLSDGTIVCGHSRVQAAQLNGWTEIEVWVRDDLDEPDAVTRRLIEDNYLRRQLSPLDQARCIKELFEIEKKNKTVKGKGNLRDQIAAELKMSGRNLERYLNLLKTPMEVQAAFDQKSLSLEQASRVAGMKADTQKEIALAIAQGENPQEAVGRYLTQNQTWKQKPGNCSSKYLRSLAAWKVKTNQRMSAITSVAPADVKVLQDAKNVIDELLQRAEPKPVGGNKTIRKCRAKSGNGKAVSTVRCQN
jgi:ParB/RepB/Spo0J family partition protein